MSKTRKFEDVLDECLERVLVKNETIEQCLLSFPQYSDRLKPLLETALAARRVSAVTPRSKFREQARQQFKSALIEKGHLKSHISFNPWWQRGWAVAVAIVLVLSLAGGGTVYAASGSMPDSSLYKVKMAAEQLQLALTFSKLSKAELNAKLADKRVTEIVYLAEADKPEKMAMITQNMNNHLIEISTLVSAPDGLSGIAEAPAAETQPVAATALAPQQTASEETPHPAPQTVAVPPRATGAETAPVPVTKEKPSDNLTQVQGADKKASGLTPAPAESARKGKEDNQNADQRAKLKTTVESQASSNIARLNAALETAPASAKPALQIALNQSATEYKKAIESLK